MGLGPYRRRGAGPLSPPWGWATIAAVGLGHYRRRGAGPLSPPRGWAPIAAVGLGPYRCRGAGPLSPPRGGADTDTGGAPKPQRSGTSPASFAGSCHPGPPRSLRCWSLPLAFVPRGVPLSRAPCRAPCPPPCPVCPCCLPLLWRVGVLCCFFLFAVPCPPPSPLAVSSLSSPFSWVGGGVGGGGGGVLAVRPIAQARRKHGAGTRRGTCRSPGGGGLAVWLPPSPYPSRGCTPGGPPVGACTARAPFGHGRGVRPTLSFLCLPTLPRRPRGGGPLPTTVIPHVPSPSPRCPRPFPWRVWELGVGRGGRTRCPSSGVSTSQARHWHVARHLSFCWGVGHAAWPPSSPFPLRVRSPGAPPAGACTALASLGHGRVVRPAPSPRRPPFLPLCPREGGPLSAPPFLHPPPLGGRRRVGGGGLVAFPSSLSCHRHEVRHPSLCRGGGGFASWLPLSPVLPYARPPGGPPAGACTARALFGHGRVVRPATAASPPCRVALGGGGSLVASPLPALPALGGAGMGGGGRCALFVSPPLHARRRQDVGTTQSRGEALGCCGGGGGVSVWAFPPCSMV